MSPYHNLLKSNLNFNQFPALLFRINKNSNISNNHSIKFILSLQNLINKFNSKNNSNQFFKSPCLLQFIDKVIEEYENISNAFHIERESVVDIFSFISKFIIETPDIVRKNNNNNS